MARTAAIGLQDFEKVRERDCFYIDKTKFIKEWWDSRSAVTLITRPRRFGKTLTLSMVDHFFSNQYQHQDQTKWFEGLAIWKEQRYRDLMGTYPVIFLSFANIKTRNYDGAVREIKRTLFRLYNRFSFLAGSGILSEQEQQAFHSVTIEMDTEDIPSALNSLTEYLARYYGRKVIILLDEYDTPMQEAYVHGYWEEITDLFRALFNATFKTNEYLERALMTGITRISRESLFSDLNNLDIASVTVSEYEDTFGFTEEEVFSALDEFGYEDREGIRYWYDGFTFGKTKNIYNPWSILNFLKHGEFKPYWANTSSNALVSSLIRSGDVDLKQECEALIEGETITSEIDEQIVFGEMKDNPASVWSLLVASGYLKVVSVSGEQYELALTNQEVHKAFRTMIRNWFGNVQSAYNRFTKALLTGDVKAMNAYMNRVALATFSSFDTGTHPSESEPERFYQGFVLGLIVDLKDRYFVCSNRESGFGRYDVILEPRHPETDDACILEFKVQDPEEEKELRDTVAAAHAQIEEKQYAADLLARGIPAERIHAYGFAFRGKEVLIG